MSTREMKGARLDHGAQFFTVRDAVFQDYVDHWLNAGVVKEWYRKAPYDSNLEGYPRYCGIKGMNQVPKYLARTLDVQCCERVNVVEYKDGVWKIFTESKTVYQSHYLIMTLPLPQSLALLDDSGLSYASDNELGRLRSISYQRGLTTLAILEGASGLPGYGFLKLKDSPITWIADNQMKGISEIPTLRA